MSTVIYAKQFLDATAALAPRDRKVIDNTIMEFARGSKAKGLRLHKLNYRESRFYSISANKDLRIIVLIDGDTRIVMHAGHHDAAYQWAERHEVQRHEKTHEPQIIEFVESVEQRIQFTDHNPRDNPLFENLDDTLLAAVGVPSDYNRLVRKVRNEDDLGRLSSILPEEAWEALVDISAGADPEIVASELTAQTNAANIDANSSDSPVLQNFTSRTARRRFWIADNDKALEQALKMPWAVWRVFLHPTQAKSVAADHKGPARITGGAGTGKSVVLVHRAARLVQESEDVRVLLSTFSKVLANQLARNVDELIGSEPALRERVVVTHLHEHASRTLRQVEPNWSIVTTESLRKRLKAAAISVGYLAHPVSFLRDEWNHVVDYWGVESLASYLAVSRIGRGRALPRTQRELLWPVFQQVLDGLKLDNALTRAGICQHAGRVCNRQEHRYEHVLLDEAQDFGPRELCYAHSLATGDSNALFLGGDDGQRIFQNPFPLRSIGINIRGRSRRLCVNYRTSAEIHDFATQLLPEESLDGEIVESRRITSLFNGVKPQIRRCESRHEEATFIANWVKERQQAGIALGEIALLARERSRLSETVSCLESMSVQRAEKLSEREDDVLVADILHAAKGLEFRAVVLVGMEEDSLPLTAALDGEPGDEAHTLSLERERHLLYVGCTRTREILMITYLGNRSRFLPKHNVVQSHE